MLGVLQAAGLQHWPSSAPSLGMTQGVRQACWHLVRGRSRGGRGRCGRSQQGRQLEMEIFKMLQNFSPLDQRQSHFQARAQREDQRDRGTTRRECRRIRETKALPGESAGGSERQRHYQARAQEDQRDRGTTRRECSRIRETEALPGESAGGRSDPRLAPFAAMNAGSLAFLSIAILSLAASPAMPQKAPKKKPPGPLTKLTACCEEVKELKGQIANLSGLLEELARKQQADWVNVVMQVMQLEGNYKQMETRLTVAEEKYSEMDNQIQITRLAAQTQPQTTADAVYDCSSLYQKNYKISGVYNLPADELLGSREMEVYCDMETQGGGWTLIQRRKVGLTSFNRDWKQYKEGFGHVRGDFWMGNENIYRLTRRPTVLRVELEDWEGRVRYAEYAQFSISNEQNSYRLSLGNYSGNAGRDSLRYHNNTAFSTKDKDNDKCLDDCAGLRKGGYWYNCCTDSNLNGMFYRNGDHNKHSDGISWYGWHGSTYSLRRVEMKIRAQDFQP